MRIGIYGRVMLKPGSGIVRYSFELTQALLKYHPENEYVLYFMKGSVPKLDFKGKYEVREIDIPYALWRTSLFTNALKKDNIDVFHSMAYTTPAVPRRMRKVAIVSTFHGLHAEYFWWSLKENAYSFLNYRIAAKFADRILCVSQKLKEEVHERLGKRMDEIDVTYFGINQKFEPLGAKDKRKYAKYLNEKYHIPEEGFVLYAGGGNSYNKNVITVLKAWKLLKEKYGFNLPLVIARVELSGFRDALRILDLKEGKDVIGFQWVGDDLAYMYGCADISIYPSIYEGVGFPIIESMACGVPTIISNASAMPECAGGAAEIVEKPRSAEEWAEKVYALHNDKRRQKKLVALGIKRAKVFTWENVAHDTVKSYKKAMEQVSH